MLSRTIDNKKELLRSHFLTLTLNVIHIIMTNKLIKIVIKDKIEIITVLYTIQKRDFRNNKNAFNLANYKLECIS